MAEQRNSATVPLLILIVALALPVSYVATYVWICDPHGPLEMQDDGHCERKYYQYGGDIARVVFSPLQSIDWRYDP